MFRPPRNALSDRSEALSLLGGLSQRKRRLGLRFFNSAQGEVVMKRHATTTDSGTVKASASPDSSHTQQAAPWPKTEKRSDAPAPPPVWTRYIDSRLKQFCVR